MTEHIRAVIHSDRKSLSQKLLTTLDCAKIHTKTILILIYFNPATIPTTFRESHMIDQVYRQDTSKQLNTLMQKILFAKLVTLH